MSAPHNIHSIWPSPPISPMPHPMSGDRALTRALSQLSLISSKARPRATPPPPPPGGWTCPACCHHRPPPHQPVIFRAHAHSASNSQWKARQGRDHYARDAKVMGMKSRAAFKLLEV